MFRAIFRKLPPILKLPIKIALRPFFYLRRLKNDLLSILGVRFGETNILFVAGYPKSGTTWVENFISNIPGYNPREQEVVNMFNSGIIDPTKVTRLALENAASVAGTMLITETVISNIKKEENKGIDPSMMM